MDDNETAICPSLYSAYVAGTLDSALAALIASYLSHSAEARAHVGTCHRLAGTMLETLCTPVDMKAGSLQKILARLDDDDGPERPAPQGRSRPVMLADDIALPAPLAALLADGTQRLRWRNIAGGRMARLPVGGAARTVVVLHLSPGAPLPAQAQDSAGKAPQAQDSAGRAAQAQDGVNLTLVLRGSYRDGADIFRQGMMACRAAPPATNPVADATEGCLCVTTIGLETTIEEIERRPFFGFFLRRP